MLTDQGSQNGTVLNGNRILQVTQTQLFSPNILSHTSQYEDVYQNVNMFSVSLQPKVRCDPCPLTHGDEVKMGEMVLSFHFHMGTDTCDGCEPGQIIAHLSRHKKDDTSGMYMHAHIEDIKLASLHASAHNN